MASDQDIAQALESLLRQQNLTSFSFDAIVHHLESKLGSNLTHKLDFIQSQIHHLLFPQPYPHLPHRDHFAPHLQNPNYLPDFSAAPFRPPQPPPHSSLPAATAPPASVEAPVPKESGQTGKRKRGGPGGLNKLCGVSPELQPIVGHATLPRTEIVKQLWAYIRKHNLQDPNNKRKIICNDELRLVFETDCTDMFKMNKLLAKHILPLEPTKQITQNPKKLKTETESGSGSAESVPLMIVSEALANFFGTGEREMSQAEVLRQIWEYIKVNQLEDPLNSLVIVCDAKLQELFGCESVSALEISEMLERRHLFKRS